jgi:hypothetical protein
MKFLLFPLFFLLLVSCEHPSSIPQAVREDLFTLDIGRLEDQIAIYSLEGDRGMARVSMTMRDGLFYISDASGAKILRCNSYGDLLFMIYNEETNPTPLSLKPLQGDSVVTRWSVSYPLNEPGEIAVDSRKHIYVRDRLPYEKHSFDPESRALLDSVILHFDENGNFIEYLGRDGIGGAPFPRLEGLYTSVRDELVVVCRLPTGWDVYWFRSDGTFLFTVHLKNDAVPVPPDRDLVIPSLNSISAAPDSRRLYVKVDYYREIFDESTGTRSGNESDSSVVWIMNAENGSWERTVEVPFFEQIYTENNRRVSSRIFYSFLGVIQDGRIILSVPVEGGYSLLFLNPDASTGGEQRQCFIRVDSEELHFNAFDLSGEGILSGLLVDEWEVKLVWWRTDKFAEGSSL